MSDIIDIEVTSKIITNKQKHWPIKPLLKYYKNLRIGRLILQSFTVSAAVSICTDYPVYLLFKHLWSVYLCIWLVSHLNKTTLDNRDSCSRYMPSHQLTLNLLKW